MPNATSRSEAHPIGSPTECEAPAGAGADTGISRKVARNIGWLAGERLVRLAIGLFVGAWIARWLGPTQFGTLGFAVSMSIVVTQFAIAGLEHAIVKRFLDAPAEQRATFGSSFLLLGILGAAGGVVTVGLAWILRPDDTEAIVVVAVIASGVLFKPFLVLSYWNQSRVESRYSAAPQLAAFLISSAFKIGVILSGGTLLTLAWAYPLEAAVFAAGLVIAFRGREGATFRWRLDWQTARGLLLGGAPLILASAAALLNLHLDRVMTASIAGDTEAGFYNAAVRISEIVWLAPAVIGASINPGLVQLRRDSMVRYHQALDSYYALLSGLALAAVAGVLVFAPLGIRLLFGEAYLPAVDPLRIHIITAVFIFHTTLRGWALIAEERRRRIGTLALLSVIVNFMLNLALIPRFGGGGAAAATAASFALNATVFPLFRADTRRHALAFYKSFPAIPSACLSLWRSARSHGISRRAMP